MSETYTYSNPSITSPNNGKHFKTDRQTHTPRHLIVCGDNDTFLHQFLQSVRVWPEKSVGEARGGDIRKRIRALAGGGGGRGRATTTLVRLLLARRLRGAALVGARGCAREFQKRTPLETTLLGIRELRGKRQPLLHRLKHFPGNNTHTPQQSTWNAVDMGEYLTSSNCTCTQLAQFLDRVGELLMIV